MKINQYKITVTFEVACKGPKSESDDDNLAMTLSGHINKCLNDWADTNRRNTWFDMLRTTVEEAT
jgi:hypothetical protein